jgi:hypothetical protein
LGSIAFGLAGLRRPDRAARRVDPFIDHSSNLQTVAGVAAIADGSALPSTPRLCDRAEVIQF